MCENYAILFQENGFHGKTTKGLSLDFLLVFSYSINDFSKENIMCSIVCIVSIVK